MFVENVTVCACVAAISVLTVVALGQAAGVVPVFWLRVYGWVALSAPAAVAMAAAVWCVVDAARDHPGIPRAFPSRPCNRHPQTRTGTSRDRNED